MRTSGVPAGALAAIWERHSEAVRGRLDAIERAATSEAAPNLRAEGARAAHQLAGAVGMFGFAGAAEIARELEARLGGGEAGAADLSVLARALRRELAVGPGGCADRES